MQEMEMQPPSADFKLFTALWNQMQSHKTPLIHLKMADWLESCWKDQKRHLLLMAFRSAGKSTIAGLFAAWLIYTNPDIRILVLAADHNLAGKMVRNVKRIIERHPLTEGLKPSKADQWASDRFTVERSLELRDPTMIAKGVISNITGSRADIVICDDVEVPNTCDTPARREDLRERLGEIPYVLGAGGTQLYIGTPHHFYSIYSQSPCKDARDERPFLQDFERLCIPILDKNSKSTWPERYSAKDISQMRLSSGPNKFDSQMMLKPVNIMQGRLNPELLKFYDSKLSYDRITNKLFINGVQMAGASCWWDPAFGSASGDDSVCAVVFADANGNYYLHHLEYIRINEQDQTDEARQQARIVAHIAKKHYLPAITVEINGIGKFLPTMLRNELAKERILSRVEQVSSTRPKSIRIIEAFDALMAARRIHLHENVAKTNFLMEMREWRPGASKNRDDALDAVAGALSREPDRLIRISTAGGSYGWHRGGKTHKAKSSLIQNNKEI